MKEKICVFGAGEYFKSKEINLKLKYEIVTFIDNRVPVGQCENRGVYIVYNPKDWVGKCSNMKVILMSAEWFSMWEQLIELGVDNSRILFALNLQPAYDTSEELLIERDIAVYSTGKQIVFREKQVECTVSTENELKRYFRTLYADRYPYIRMISEMPIIPSSRRFGFERGVAVDRIFIERFIKKYSDEIHGTVIEIGDDRYMSLYKDKIDNPLIMHVNGWGGIRGNLATGEGIQDEVADCLICTQTLQHIYDIKPCFKNIYRLLKPGGTALITNGCELP